MQEAYGRNLHAGDTSRLCNLRVSTCRPPCDTQNQTRSQAGVPAKRLAAADRHVQRRTQSVQGARGGLCAMRGCSKSRRPRGTLKHSRSPASDRYPKWWMRTAIRSQVDRLLNQECLMERLGSERTWEHLASGHMRILWEHMGSDCTRTRNGSTDP